MYTDQHTSRSGIEGANSVALRTVLRYRQVLPQGGEGIPRGYSARPCEGSNPQPGCSGEHLSAEKRRNGHCRSFYAQSRESAEDGRDQTYKNFPQRGESRKCAYGAYCDSSRRNASAQRWI